jgi:hypothetical protein
VDTEIIERNGVRIAAVHCDMPVITDGQSALDFIASIGWEHKCQNITVNKAAFSAEFFRLSGGLAGEIAQKFVNYNFRVAVFGDFSVYDSKPLRDYMYECNEGNRLYFVDTETAALAKLADGV